MIRLSANVLTSAIALLKRLDTYHFLSLSELSYSKIASISAEDIFLFSKNCGWVSETESTLHYSAWKRTLEITESGVAQ